MLTLQNALKYLRYKECLKFTDRMSQLEQIITYWFNNICITFTGAL